MKQVTVKTKLITMLQMQDAMNSRVNPDWRSSNNEWYRAIWTECAEMLDHYGWKWWKHQQPELDQVKLELVDIFHFALSDCWLKNSSAEEAANQISTELAGYDTSANNSADTSADFRLAIEKMAMQTLQNRSMHFSDFSMLMQLMDMDFDELYRMYVGKNVLNFFRQDHGYKDGSYIKVWQGQEDNEHLAALLQSLNINSATFRDDVYAGLKAAYPAA